MDTLPCFFNDVPTELKQIIVWHVNERSFGLPPLLPARPLSQTLDNCLVHLAWNKERKPDHVIDRYRFVDGMKSVCFSWRGWRAALAPMWLAMPIKRAHHRLRKALLVHVKALRALATVNREWCALIVQWWQPVYEQFRAFDSWWVSRSNPLYLDAAPADAPPRWYELALVLTMFRPRHETFWNILASYEENTKFGYRWAYPSLPRVVCDTKDLIDRRRAQERVRSIVKLLEHERFFCVLAARRKAVHTQ